jgi:hypothetical protein
MLKILSFLSNSGLFVAQARLTASEASIPVEHLDDAVIRAERRTYLQEGIGKTVRSTNQYHSRTKY